MADWLERFVQGAATVDFVDDLVEAGRRVRTCSLQFEDLGGTTRFGGPVRTVRCKEDNALVKATLATPGNGAVLVVDGGGSLRTALTGDLIAGLAIDNGWSGLLINGAVRDRVALGEMALGIKALGTNPAKSAKTGAGEVDVPVEFGGVRFEVGELVFCDDDGVLVIGRD